MSRPADAPSLDPGDAARTRAIEGASADFWPLVPATAPPLEYDYRNAALYLRLLVAEASGATERDIARGVFLHVKTDSPRIARLAARSHLERAHWLLENDFLPLIWALDD